MSYTTNLNPVAKWQLLIAEHAGLDVSRMHYQSAKDFLAEQGISLVFANTVKTRQGTSAYVAVIEYEHDWLAFVTEAAGAWRKDVARFCLILRGKVRITEILLFGIGWTGERFTQREAIEIASLAIFTRENGQASYLQ